MLAILAIPMGIRIAYKGIAWSRTTKDFAAAGELVYRANCPNLGRGHRRLRRDRRPHPA